MSAEISVSVPLYHAIQGGTHEEEKAAEWGEILPSSVWRWSWTNRLLWLSRIQRGFRGTKMVRGWRNKLQISTWSANESPWPLSNPINIHAPWVGLQVDVGFNQFHCHDHVMTFWTTNRSANVPTNDNSSPLWFFWCVREEQHMNDLPQCKQGQINQSVSCWTEYKNPPTTSRAPADTLINQTHMNMTLKAVRSFCC